MSAERDAFWHAAWSNAATEGYEASDFFAFADGADWALAWLVAIVAMAEAIADRCDSHPILSRSRCMHGTNGCMKMHFEH